MDWKLPRQVVIVHGTDNRVAHARAIFSYFHAVKQGPAGAVWDAVSATDAASLQNTLMRIPDKVCAVAFCRAAPGKAPGDLLPDRGPEGRADRGGDRAGGQAPHERPGDGAHRAFVPLLLRQGSKGAGPDLDPPPARD